MQGARAHGETLVKPSVPVVSVNADDFGASGSVNRAIAECIRSGLVTNTTAMANMPGFEEACALAGDHGFRERVGVHLNLTEGEPLTDAIRKNRRFCDDDGRFHYRRQRVVFLAADRACVAQEVEAQILRCRRNGLAALHTDSHRHVHTNLALFRVIEPVLRHHGVRRVRISANLHTVDALVRKYKCAFRWYVLWKGYMVTDHFGDIAEFLPPAGQPSHAPGKYEVMVHPGYGEQGSLIDALDGYPLRTMLERLVRQFTVVPL